MRSRAESVDINETMLDATRVKDRQSVCESRRMVCTSRGV